MYVRLRVVVTTILLLSKAYAYDEHVVYSIRAFYTHTQGDVWVDDYYTCNRFVLVEQVDSEQKWPVGVANLNVQLNCVLDE